MEMIAVCPNCHDAIHHGAIAISDDVVRAWKRIRRVSSSVRDLIYVEPGARCAVGLTRTLSVESVQDTVVVEFAGLQRIAFRVIDQEILLLDLHIRGH